MSKVKTVKQKVMIPEVSPKEVYEMFTDPKKHGAFTGGKATGKAEVGGKFTAWDGNIFGKYLELEDGKRFVQEWNDTDFPQDGQPWKLELCFNNVPEGTEVVMALSGVGEELADEMPANWTQYYWDPLKDYLSKHSKSKTK
jgi:activator of HSP90 ATPase